MAVEAIIDRHVGKFFVFVLSTGGRGRDKRWRLVQTSSADLSRLAAGSWPRRRRVEARNKTIIKPIFPHVPTGLALTFHTLCGCSFTPWHANAVASPRAKS